MSDIVTASEDGAIMFARQRLTAYWFDVLNDTERAAWSDKFSNFQPRDAAGHTYTTATPSAFSDVLVNAQTQYAWSQIFGVYRLNAQPVGTPGSVDRPTISIDSFDLTHDHLRARFTASLPIANARGLLIYMTTYAGKDKPITRARLRPVAQWVGDFTPRTLDFTDAAIHRFGPIVSATVGLTAMAVDLNNMLVYTAPFETVTIT